MVRRIAPEPEDEPVVLPAETPAPDDDVVIEDIQPERELPKRAVQNADGTVSLPLRFPRTLKVQRAGGETIREDRFEEIRLHRMTGADLAAIASVTGEAQMATAFTRATRLNPAIANRLFGKLDAADAADAGAVISFFMGAGGRTGR
jgi:hypothetical protein